MLRAFYRFFPWSIAVFCLADCSDSRFSSDQFGFGHESEKSIQSSETTIDIPPSTEGEKSSAVDPENVSGTYLTCLFAAADSDELMCDLAPGAVPAGFRKIVSVELIMPNNDVVPVEDYSGEIDDDGDFSVHVYDESLRQAAFISVAISNSASVDASVQVIKAPISRAAVSSDLSAAASAPETSSSPESRGPKIWLADFKNLKSNSLNKDLKVSNSQWFLGSSWDWFSTWLGKNVVSGEGMIRVLKSQKDWLWTRSMWPKYSQFCEEDSDLRDEVKDGSRPRPIASDYAASFMNGTVRISAQIGIEGLKSKFESTDPNCPIMLSDTKAMCGAGIYANFDTGPAAADGSPASMKVWFGTFWQEDGSNTPVQHLVIAQAKPTADGKAWNMIQDLVVPDATVPGTLFDLSLELDPAGHSISYEVKGQPFKGQLAYTISDRVVLSGDDLCRVGLRMQTGVRTDARVRLIKVEGK